MEPALPAGSLVVARPLTSSDVLHAGDVVVARRPDRPSVEVVKRIHSIDAEGIFLTGDNRSRSTDSREFGPVARNQVIARIRWRYWPLPPKRV